MPAQLPPLPSIEPPPHTVFHTPPSHCPRCLRSLAGSAVCMHCAPRQPARMSNTGKMVLVAVAIIFLIGLWLALLTRSP